MTPPAAAGDGVVNVLHLRDTARICGPGKTIIETALAADRSRFHTIVGVFTAVGRANAYVDAVRDRGIDVVPLAARRGLDPALPRQIVRLIRERRVHIVHSHDFLSDVLTRLLAPWTGVATMSTVHGWIENDTRSRANIRASQWALRGLDRVVAVSEETRQRVLRAGVRPERLSVIHNAIVAANYRAADVEAGAFRRRHGLDAGAVVIGNVGRLSPEKGQADFLRAAAGVMREQLRVRLVLAGDGPDEAALRALAVTLGIDDRTVFAGHLTDVRPLYRDLDALALTSYTEGFPNVVLEALCMDVPVLATAVGGVPEILVDDETGLLVAAGDVAAIGRGLARLAGDRAAAARLAARGRARVLAQFEFAVRTPKEEALYDVLTRGRRD